MKFPNKYLRNIKPYKLASHKIWAVEPNQRNEILKLDWNEATIPPTPKVTEAIKSLLEEPSFFNLYPTTLNDNLLNKLSEYIEISTKNIQYFGSSDSLHEYICKVFISVGDPVLILGPTYDNFRLTCQANGADVYWAYYEDDFSFNPNSFEKTIREIEPAVVYICNPNNPTGNLHKVEYIQHLLDNFPDTLFLIDEAYYEFSGETCKELVLDYDNILISRTMSKAFALANFRVGYLIASKDNVQFINRIRNPKNLTTFAQAAAYAALSDIDYMQNYVTEVNKAKVWFQQQLESLYPDKLTVFNSAGNFIMIKCDNKTDIIKFLSDHNIFVRDCTQGPSVTKCFRITIGTISQMNQVVNAIRLFYGA